MVDGGWLCGPCLQKRIEVIIVSDISQNQPTSLATSSSSVNNVNRSECVCVNDVVVAACCK